MMLAHSETRRPYFAFTHPSVTNLLSEEFVIILFPQLNNDNNDNNNNNNNNVYYDHDDKL